MGLAGPADWRSDVQASGSLPDRDGRKRWWEQDSHGHKITYELVEDKMPWRRVTRMAEKNLPFGGTWTIDISPTPEGSVVRITEDGRPHRHPRSRQVRRYCRLTRQSRGRHPASGTYPLGDERRCDLSQTRGLNRAPPPPRARDLLPLLCPITGPVPVLVYVVKSIAGLAGDPFSHGTADSEHPPQPVRGNPSVGVVRLGDAHPLLHRPHHPLRLRPAPLRHHPHLFQAQEEDDHRTGAALPPTAPCHHSTASL